MKNKKPIMIILGVSLGLHGLASLILILAAMNQAAIYRLMGLPRDMMNVRVIPWSNILGVVSKLILLILMFVLVTVVNGKALRIFGIVVAIASILNNVVSVFGGRIESVFVARNGTMMLSAISAFNSFTSLVLSPLSAISAGGLLFACGMCVVYEKSLS